MQEWLALESQPATLRRPSACSVRGASVVILQATQESTSAWQGIVKQISQLRSLLRSRGHPAPLFLIMGRTDVSHPAGWETRPDPFGLQKPTAPKEISSFERWLLRETQGVAGVTVIPVSVGTVQGIALGLLRHEPGSAWHFMDPGQTFRPYNHNDNPNPNPNPITPTLTCGTFHGHRPNLSGASDAQHHQAVLVSSRLLGTRVRVAAASGPAIERECAPR